MKRSVVLVKCLFGHFAAEKNRVWVTDAQQIDDSLNLRLLKLASTSPLFPECLAADSQLVSDIVCLETLTLHHIFKKRAVRIITSVSCPLGHFE